jgi:NAD-dependent DNA ligase
MTEQNTTDEKAFDLRNKTICITGTLRQMDRESATAWAELELGAR